jgi:hypothetical protein
MRRFLIRLAIGLVTFIIGVTAATLLAGLFGLNAAKQRCQGSTFPVPPPPPAMTHSCPSMRHFDAPPPPVVVEVPAPPVAPAPPAKIKIHVRSDDGTVKVVELPAEKANEK